MLCCLVKWYDDNLDRVMDIINPRIEYKITVSPRPFFQPKNSDQSNMCLFGHLCRPIFQVEVCFDAL